MDLYEIVTKLNGPVYAVGETNIDIERFRNLTELTKLVNKLLSDIDDAAKDKDRQESSMSKSGKFADDFMAELSDATQGRGHDANSWEPSQINAVYLLSRNSQDVSENTSART